MERLKGVKLGYGICASFCTMEEIIGPMQMLKEEGAELYPIMSENAYTMDTRFGTKESIIEKFEKITGNPVQHKIVETEFIGPQNPYQALIVAPCTGNTLAKMANGITDTAILMAIKGTLRNNNPIILGLASNDALGLNLKNIGVLLNAKNIFFVPFGQDDPIKKKNSLISKMEWILETVLYAMEGKQIQPLLITHGSV